MNVLTLSSRRSLGFYIFDLKKIKIEMKFPDTWKSWKQTMHTLFIKVSVYNQLLLNFPLILLRTIRIT